jgi:hypothetical protein
MFAPTMPATDLPKRVFDLDLASAVSSTTS